MIKTILLLVVLTAACAFANIQFALTPAVLATPPGGLPDGTCFTSSGSCLIFTGTITSDSTTITNITDISIDFPGVADAPNGDLYLSNGPTCIGQNTDLCNYFFSFSGPAFVSSDFPYAGGLFALDVDPATPPGLYDGVVTFFGGPNISDTDVIGGPIDFQVEVVPEPATFGLMLLGLALGAGAVYRKRTNAN